MKKYLVAMAVALMVCMLGMTAMAEEAETVDVEAALEEEVALSEECHDIIDAIDPNGGDVHTQMQVMTEVYENAGWTVIKEAPIARSVDIDPEIMELAYSDIDKADPEMKEKILDAREVVIFHNSWINDLCPDGVAFSYSIDLAKKEIGFYPLFSELFPGWDPPRPDNTDIEQNAPVNYVLEGFARANAPTGTLSIFNARKYLTKPNGVAPNFAGGPTVRNVRNTFRVGAMQSYTTGLTAVNIGYQYFPSGNYGNFTTNYPVGAPYPLEIAPGSTNTIREVRGRISTYETPGYAQVVMTRTT